VALSATVTFLVIASPSLAHATVSITVPSSTNLGSVPTGSGSLSTQVGPVTVTATGILGVVLPSFTATVSSTSFTAAGGQTISASSISYWSGPTTSTSGGQTATPGQATAAQAQTLAAPVTAFNSVGLVLTITTTWNPTIVVNIPPAAVAGTYSGTITHSVA
jgi:hypothetical protein